MHVKKKSQLQEKRIAKDLNGKIVPGSGAMWHSKGDTNLNLFLVEAKYTEEDYYRLKVSLWDKIKKEAYRIGKLPLFQIELQERLNREEDKIIIMSVDDFEGYNFHETFKFIKFPVIELMDKKSVTIDYTLFDEELNETFKSHIDEGDVFYPIRVLEFKDYLLVAMYYKDFVQCYRELKLDELEV